MAEESGSAEAGTVVDIIIKSSKDAKYNLKVPLTSTVGELKAKLSTPGYADISADRMRLIYSGRVLKDPDALESIKIKDGHTIHLVQGAASNARQNPSAQGSSTSTSSNTAASPGSQGAAAGQVPSNLATGTGNNPLASLTGARFAGFHGLPGADMFGPDGGMGPPPNPDEMLRMMENPAFLSQMNEAMNNPAVIQMMQDSPMVRDNPMLRQMLQNPETRRMIFNPEMMRMQIQLQRDMNRNTNSFPAPGVTDTTPGQEGAATGQTQQNTSGQNAQPNPFGGAGGLPDLSNLIQAMQGGGQGSAPANPFAAMFGQPSFSTGAGTTPATSPPPASTGQGTPAHGTGAGSPQGGDQQNNPFAQMMNMFGGAQGGMGAFNPYTAFGGMQQPQSPPDNRPPEERYADQLRQLNDMGFYDFDRNVAALRRSGGSVQGAVDNLLNNP